MNKMIGSKKGDAEAISEIWFAIGVCLIAVIMLSFAENLHKNEISEAQKNAILEAQADRLIALYLKSPVTVEGLEEQELTMADLIVLYSEDKSNLGFLKTFQSHTQAFLTSNDPIQLKVNSDRILITNTGTPSGDESGRNREYKFTRIVYLPSHLGEPLKISIMVYAAED